MSKTIKRVGSKINSILLSLKYQLFKRDEGSLITEMGHRDFIGKEFENEGLRQFGLVKELGVTEKSRFLDVACGSLRLGRHLIPFLDEGHYFGIEQHQALIDGGLAEEIDAETVRQKKPTLYTNSNFDLGDLQGIDFAWANSLFSHLVEKDIMTCLVSVEKALGEGGVFYASFFEGRRNMLTQYFGSHSRVGFLYPHDVMAEFGNRAGLDTEYFANMKNSRGQKIMAFKKRS